MRDLASLLEAAGCLAPEDEAAALRSAAKRLARPLEELVARRTAGEPLAWITGQVDFAGCVLEMRAGVYVPRPHTEWLALRAARLVEAADAAVDLCTGCGAVAAVVAAAAPHAEVWATDTDPAAIDLARRNGVRALLGDLDQPLPETLRGRCRLVTCVPPYVPLNELALLPRDVRAHEPRAALVGGDADGLRTARRAMAAAARLLAGGGTLLIEAGHDQCGRLAEAAGDEGLAVIAIHHDADGEARAVEARAD